jgi:hypothetical protein
VQNEIGQLPGGEPSGEEALNGIPVTVIGVRT